MSVLCNINLNKPPEAPYLPGETISGIIRYTIKEPMETEKIIISLKGMGHLKIIHRQSNHNKNRISNNRTYINDEVYVDNDAVIHHGNWTVPPGDYEARFAFPLPLNIPPSLKYSGYRGRYRVYAYIKYYVRIKFERSGLFSFSKHFRKKIIVASGVAPRLPMEPCEYTKSRNLISFFSSKTRTIHLKGNILSSVIPHGGKIQIECDIHNDTNLDLTHVEVNLTQVYTFKIRFREIPFYDDVKPCYTKTQAIERGAKQKVLFEFNVPLGCVSVEHSDLLSREYIVTITAKVPMPYRNVKLSIPVQIGDNMIIQHQEVVEPPPTYWEAMREGEKDDNDDENEKEITFRMEI